LKNTSISFSRKDLLGWALENNLGENEERGL
jgi:hypothetical protein